MWYKVGNDGISTHAPREGSDRPRERGDRGVRISTHAPREGSDRIVHGEFVHAHEFQPTLPARGATRRRAGHAQDGSISTHAPREGSDIH